MKSWWQKRRRNQNHSTSPLLNRKKENDADKKAVLVGLNYKRTRVALKGCINDARRMGRLLKRKYNYKDIQILTDRNLSVDYNILEILENLIATNHKTVYFQYSGHGVQTKDQNGDEIDGKDEALYSINNTIIIDDEINERICQVKKGTTMIIVIDACHSGTVIDLPYQLDNYTNKVVKVNNGQNSNQNIEGNVICITGCRDDQVSMDVTSGRTSYGAMSNSLQTALKRINSSNKPVSWKMLVADMKEILKKDRYAQIPQLCVSSPELVDSVISF